MPPLSDWRYRQKLTMFNLLPQQDRNKLISEYRLRFAIVGLLMFSALGTVAFAALAPSFFISYQKEVLTRKNSNLLKDEIALRSKDNFVDILTTAAKQAAALEVMSPVPYTYELVADVINSATSAIKITGVQVETDAKEGRDVVVTGQARNRDALLAYVRVLEKKKAFVGVTVPVSNFAASSDIDFSVLVRAK